MKKTLRRMYKKITRRNRIRCIDQEMLKLSVRLSEKHLDNCMVFPDRQSMISSFPKNGIIVEVGVAQGDFSAYMFETASPKILYLVDAWAMGKNSNYGQKGFLNVKNRFNAQIKAGRVQIKRGYSHEKLEEFDQNSLDWIYIDASHDFKSVEKDLEISYTKIRIGGIISGHDYHRWGRYGKRFGVLEAVNSFCVQYDLSFIGLSLENDYNWSYALRVDK